MTDRLRFIKDATGPGRVEDRRPEGPQTMGLGDHLQGLVAATGDAVGRVVTNPPAPLEGTPLGELTPETRTSGEAGPSQTAPTRGKMSADQAFAQAVRVAETGPPDGDYAAIRGIVRGRARLLGAYGFPSDEWSTMAADAGLPGARWQDRKAQDAVARTTFNRLHRKYNDWRLVAVAWKAGEQGADRINMDPTLLEQPTVKPLADWASSVMRNVQEQAVTAGTPPELLDRSQFNSRWDDMLGREPIQDPMVLPGGDGQDDEAEAVLRRRLYAMRERVRNQPEIGPDGTRVPAEPAAPAEPEQEMVRRGRGQGAAVGQRADPERQGTTTRKGFFRPREAR